MRLLNSATLEFEIFNEESLPEYLILSHTWGSEEISFQDMRYLQKLKTLPEAMQQDATVMFSLGLATGTSHVSKQEIESTAGYRKVVATAKAAVEKKYQYFWIDTCCIDKSSSSELQEAINSMYRWYQEASLCIVVLEDVSVGGYEYIGESHFGHLLAQTRWITRGWTLQELIAPRSMNFVNADWQFLTSKSVASWELSSATGIPRHVLETGNMGQTSIAQKMSWAAHRTTTRLEDRAYSLLGIFGVNIPMLYGEGANAFRRLQEEILRVTPDDSIFYWQSDTDCSATCRGLLAPSPSAFKACGNITAGPPVLVSNTNMGISLRLRIKGIQSSVYDHHSIGLLNAQDGKLICAITLRVLNGGVFSGGGEFGKRCARVSTHAASTYDIRKVKEYSTIYVSHQPQVSSKMFTTEAYCFRFRFTHERNRLRIGRTWPPSMRDHNGEMVLIPPENKNFVFFAQIVVQYKNGPGTEICKMVAGINSSRSTVWCKLVQDNIAWPQDGRAPDTSTWADFSKKTMTPLSNPARASSLLLDESCVPDLAESLRWVSVQVVAGLAQHKICYFVEISETPHKAVYD